MVFQNMFKKLASSEKPVNIRKILPCQIMVK